MSTNKLKPGKRYWWNISGVRRDALFTGYYDKNNGNAILQDSKSGSWSIPVEELHLLKKKSLKNG